MSFGSKCTMPFRSRYGNQQFYSCLHYKYRSRALKGRSKLRAAIGLRAALFYFLLHQNSSLFTVTFGEKVLTLAKRRGP